MTNAHGLIPPDFKQCQARPNVLDHSPFSLGPMPKPIRCPNLPVWLALEIKPGRDGIHGSMTLCQSCSELLLESKSMRERVQLQPLLSNHSGKSDEHLQAELLND